MWETIKNAILRLFGVTPNKTDEEARGHVEENRAYEDIFKTNMTAIVANKLATLTVTESTASVTGDNRRAELLNEMLSASWDNAHEIVARAFGTGGVAIVPYVAGGKIYTDIVPKDRFIINRSQGTDILSATILADVIIRKGRKYFRYTDYSLENGAYVIRSRATRDGNEIPLAYLPEWESIPEEIRIGGVDRLLIAYLRCPVNRGRTDNLYGVPITLGSGDIIKQIEDCLKQIESEFKNKKAIIFADTTLFDKDEKISASLFKKTVGADSLSSGSFFEVFDPAFRDTAYYNRLDHLFGLLEKSIGCSRGILTEPQSLGATATEIKRGSYDTFALITSMRRQIEAAVKDLVYAFNIYANAFNLSPGGEYDITFDWSNDLMESSTEAWQQMKEGQSIGVVKKQELRQWLYPGESPEEAQAVIEDIAENEPSLGSLLGD